MTGRPGGLLVVISGPSGVGKGTVVRRLLDVVPDAVFSVSVTTRPPRGSEVDGVDYRFLEDEEFDRLVEEGALLEWAVYAGHRYGTRRQWVDEKLEQGRVVLLDIDVQGAEQIRQHRPDALLVFLVAPSDEELQRRLAMRGTESDEERARRLATARAEMAAGERFDHVVVNDDVERCVEEIGGLIRACVDAGSP